MDAFGLAFFGDNFYRQNILKRKGGLRKQNGRRLVPKGQFKKSLVFTQSTGSISMQIKALFALWISAQAKKVSKI